MVSVMFTHWWGICLFVGGIVIALCGVLRLWLYRRERNDAGRGQPLMSAENSKQISLYAAKQRAMPVTSASEPLPPLNPSLGETLDDLSQSKGITAWYKKNSAIAKRQRAGEVIEAEIAAAKKRIEYIRTVAEESSVVDEERLRIAKLHQEMDRLELQDLVERQRLLKELEELERDVRVLRSQPEPVESANSIQDKRQQEIQRLKEKHEHDIAVKKLQAEHALQTRQEILAVMNEKIAEIEANDRYSTAKKQELIEDIEDHYRTFLSRGA